MPVRHFHIAVFFLAISLPAIGQQIPIGNWSDQLPYTRAIAVINTGADIWCATPYSLFSYNQADNSFNRWSKVNGLHETGISSIGWDESSRSLVIAYTNSNIDIIRDDGHIDNISDVSLSQTQADKSISNIYCSAGKAYLSAGLGILVADLDRLEISDTYIIGDSGNPVKVYQTAAYAGYLFAATAGGLKRVSLGEPNPGDFRKWENLSGQNGLPAGPVAQLAADQEWLAATVRDSLYADSAGQWRLIYSGGWQIRSITPSNGGWLLTETQAGSGRLSWIDRSGQLLKQSSSARYTGLPLMTASDQSSTWIADSLAGLSRLEGNQFSSYAPNSAGGPATGQLLVADGSLWASSGGVSSQWTGLGDRDGFFEWKDGNWVLYNRFSVPALDSMPDMMALSKDPVDGTVWAGSFGGGLLHLLAGGQVEVYKQNSFLQPDQRFPDAYRVSALCTDAQKNLWLVNYGAARPLLARASDKNWYSFSIPFPLNGQALSSLVTDDLDQIWLAAANGQGLICFNDGNTLANSGDDQWKWYRAGAGQGNLPSDTVLCLARDKNGFIWVGTDRGLALIQCAGQVFTSAGCDAIWPVVQQDNFAGYLFQDERVQAVAVDGADRKWVGTKKGVWLISADGEQTIQHFTAANSPLPDNDVRQIAIDGESGMVYISTAKGICGYRGSATESASSEGHLLVFPNPVPPGYTGSIAIRGLPDQALVRITEADGRLVYETRALGGQAVWNGRNYRGQIASSGVYLVLIRDDSGQYKAVTKIVFIRR